MDYYKVGSMETGIAQSPNRRLKALTCRELGADYFDRINKVQLQHHLIRRLRGLPGSHRDRTVGRVPLPVGEAAAKRRVRVTWFAAVMLAIAVVLGTTLVSVLYFNRVTPSRPPEIRVEVNTPSTADPVSFAIKLNGQSFSGRTVNVEDAKSPAS